MAKFKMQPNMIWDWNKNIVAIVVVLTFVAAMVIVTVDIKKINNAKKKWPIYSACNTVKN